MDWVKDFYSQTGHWWGPAEAKITWVDEHRAEIVQRFTPAEGRVLELGCGYGTTATAMASAGVEVTAIDMSDRIDFAPALTNAALTNAALTNPALTNPALTNPALTNPAFTNPTFIKADFYDADLGGGFDGVCYWDGFGVGSDDDQLRLLHRIADDWLADTGAAVIEVYDPTGFQHDDGLVETKHASAERGYASTLGHRRSYDATTCRAIDTWWNVDDGVEHSQSLRCYSTAEFETLVAGSGLLLDQVLPELRTDWAYLTVLRHA